MNGSTRLILFIYNLVFLFLAAALIAALTVGDYDLVSCAQWAVATARNKVLLGLVGVVVGILAFIGIIKSLAPGTRKAKAIPIEGSVIGNIGITVPAVNAIIMMAVKKISGVREVKAKISESPGGLIVDMQTMINTEYKVPEMSMDIQNAVKENLENIGGLKVAEIRVLVDYFAVPDKGSNI
ncbi:MAG: alkaline shock response membrane anchor protein AmaP [Syntrophomonadaceae bacterium]|nr:alkaline shock response membrane anchor protein AmaP [Syntrophomonadaceae bacterium]